MKLLSERLEERATFEDARVLEQAKRDGFVPEVYSGSQTGALLREAAAALRAVEGAAWIPCSERLPEHYEHVETWPPYDEQTYNFYAHRDGGTNGVKAGNWYHNDREGYDWQFSPTHWRRISAPLDAAGSAEGVG